MNEDSKNYEMQILAMMINQYLDDMVSLSEEKLNQLEANRDQIVWDLATRIYKESGHKVEFHIVRNLINSRIAVMRYQLFFSKSSLLESKRIDEEKAMKIAEQKANAIINDKKIDDTEKITSQENERQLAIFIKVQEIISDQLEVEKSQIHIDDELFYLQSAERVSSYSSDSFYSSCSSFGFGRNSCLLSNWGGDELDTIDLIMALEEEFDLELSDEKCQEFTTVKKLVDYLAENLGK
ncbi:MAG: acyl carrier protein [Microcystis aeruginosa LL13-03]|nr:acyl carrier protein [Microcystis aeruginosa SX13-11]NCR16511.1 acyl carrier protein [Microcystis aeruginosa LL13-03]NCR43121.1 acyl carrier protein [Microcystis aeruginosa SX13-01]NCR65676.1 acyl carrier protein [Microcystis aeruginosa LL11-07]NCR88169.1 acyl carrier protein [Microcystis aeruginosa G13-10]NCS14634.1 acyl carrier protein [Microcystis aeruginosa G13-12]NCS19672.1 acyl carrier protein [Microcystis aeruginosa G11-06]NCS33418.1 acyl carrier protein [Microcystis aeruginosa G11